MTDHENRPETERETDLIFGRNPVSEALRSGRAIDSILVVKGEHSGSVPHLLAEAKEKGIPVKEVDHRKLDFLCGQANHQGIAAQCAVKAYVTLDDLFEIASSRGEPPFIVICDEIEDPHNLGAILRTAEAAGAHGVVVPARRSAPLGTAVAKTSAGAVEFIAVARVVNLSAAIEEVKKRGLWVYCADMEGQPYYEADLSGPIALVIGSEGKGVGRLVREKCDAAVSLPMKGKINSLNASVAAGILMYEVSRRRTAGK